MLRDQGDLISQIPRGDISHVTSIHKNPPARDVIEPSKQEVSACDDCGEESLVGSGCPSLPRLDRPSSPPPLDQLTLDADTEDEFEANENRAFQAFRDVQATQKVNSHVTRRQRASDSTTSTVTSMDARLIKDKVKRHMKSKQQQLYARRIRKSGEAALVTKQRREHYDDIKQSTDAVWY